MWPTTDGVRLHDAAATWRPRPLGPRLALRYLHSDPSGAQLRIAAACAANPAASGMFALRLVSQGVGLGRHTLDVSGRRSLCARLRGMATSNDASGGTAAPAPPAATEQQPAAAAATPASTQQQQPKVRNYPDEPRVGVGIVILRQLPPTDQPEVLLIRRAKEPSKGKPLFCASFPWQYLFPWDLEQPRCDLRITPSHAIVVACARQHWLVKGAAAGPCSCCWRNLPPCLHPAPRPRRQVVLPRRQPGAGGKPSGLCSEGNTRRDRPAAAQRATARCGRRPHLCAAAGCDRCLRHAWCIGGASGHPLHAVVLHALQQLPPVPAQLRPAPGTPLVAAPPTTSRAT